MVFGDDIKILKGKTLTAIDVHGDESILFTCDDGKQYKMFHQQNCCENVTIEDVNGEWSDLLNSPLVVAEEVTNRNDGPKLSEYDDSYTWTFYRFATIKGWVVLRWYGTSNGYYSEEVNFIEV